MEYAAIGVAVIGVLLALYTALVPLSKVSSTMSALESKMVRSELASETGLILSKISSVSWDVYKIQAQGEAALYHNSEYIVKRQVDGTYRLTSTGDALLAPQLRDTIVDFRKAQTLRDDKALILEQLGVQTLVKEALSKELPPGVMMGTVITYLAQS